MTPFGRGVVGDSLLQNRPGDPEVNVAVFEVSYIFLKVQGPRAKQRT